MWHKIFFIIASVLGFFSILIGFHFSAASIIDTKIPHNNVDMVQPELAFGKERMILPGAKLIALTFDDGPHEEFTPKLLDVLKQKNVLATFYVVGSEIELNENKSILRRTAHEGHEIGNHTYEHKKLTFFKPEAIQEQLEKNAQLIHETIGFYPPTMRPPYGAINNYVLSHLNQPCILWSIDPRDWENQNSEFIAKHIVEKASHNQIIVLHDLYQSTVDAVPTIIDQLQNQGYMFVTVSELFEFRKNPELLNSNQLFRNKI